MRGDAGIATTACSSSSCAAASLHARVASASSCTRARRAGTPRTTGRSRRSATPSRPSSGASPPTSPVSAGSTSCWRAAAPRCGRCSRACPTSSSSASRRSPWPSPPSISSPAGRRSAATPTSRLRARRSGPRRPDAAAAELHAVVSLQRARSRGERCREAPARPAAGAPNAGHSRSCCSAPASTVERARSRRRHGTCAAALRSRAARSRTTSCSAASATWRCSAAEGNLRAAADARRSKPSPWQSAHEWLELPQVAPALLALGWAEHCGATTAAADTLARAAHAARASSDLPLRLQIAALSALTQLESSDGARRALEMLRGPVDEVGEWRAPDLLEQLLRSVEARLLLAAGEVAEASEVVRALPECAARAVIEARAALVHAAPASGARRAADTRRQRRRRRSGDAYRGARAGRRRPAPRSSTTRAPPASLERALELAGAERFPWVFLQAGSPLRDLLVRQVRQGTRHRGLVEELQVLAQPTRGRARPRRARRRCSSPSASASDGAWLSRDDALDRGDRGASCSCPRIP